MTTMKTSRTEFFESSELVASSWPGIRIRRHLLSVLAILLSFWLCLESQFPSARAQSSPTTVSQQQPHEEWKRYMAKDIPYEIAMRLMYRKEGTFGSHGIIFVYLESSLFTKDNVLSVFRHISSKIPLQTTLFVTLLTDRDLMIQRVTKYTGWTSSSDNGYTRLSANASACCLQNFKGAQFDRYPSKADFVICDNGQAQEIIAEIEK